MTKKLWTVYLILFAFVANSFALDTNQMFHIQQWITNHPAIMKRGTVVIRKALCEYREVISDTPQPPIYESRDAYSHELVIKDIVQNRYGPLSDYVGLTAKQRFDLLRSRLDTAYNNATNQAMRNQAMYDAQTIKSVNDMAKEEGGGMSHPDFLHPSNAIPQPDIIVYDQTVCEKNGWPVLSGDDVEQVMRYVWKPDRIERPAYAVFKVDISISDDDAVLFSSDIRELSKAYDFDTRQLHVFLDSEDTSNYVLNVYSDGCYFQYIPDSEITDKLSNMSEPQKCEYRWYTNGIWDAFQDGWLKQPTNYPSF